MKPNDEPELDRLDLHHHVNLLVLRNKLHLAPLNNPHRVLDIGTGTGIWAMDFADENPAASVVGTDLSPVQPNWVPPNLEFQVDDVEDVWTFPYKFDYIHIRSMSGAVGDWKRLFKQAYDHLSPGGCIEIQEHEVWIRSEDDSIKKAVNISRWQEGLDQASRMIEKPFLVAASMRQWLLDSGFVNVEENIQKVPHGPWARDRELKRIGLFQREQMLEAASSYGCAHFTRVLNWTNEEYEVLAACVRTEIRNPAFKLFSNL
ncbi:hypothetical protein W97_09312 [Coniosporium apollinis CBS 100218]|uniref:Methyltransferase domain-containing protein n=1 Tax=Coniosporium apollinis (strain CBS 100218) TaxID=1168221 RepID=R7Z7N9_CONA1|nr:uncharacterized protein W97_09312 [Coniosporium apollinis CBS 100218]EON70044.1 hypothetical protein W97_09312 [Coniosporium apollinis CBS 100218]